MSVSPLSFLFEYCIQILGKSTHHQLPGAALLTLNFTPKDILNEGKSKVSNL